MKSSPNRATLAASSSGLRLFDGAALLLPARAVRCPQVHDAARMGQAMPHVKSRFLNWISGIPSGRRLTFPVG